MRKSRVLVAAAGLLFGLVVLWLRVGWLQLAMHGFYVERANLNQEQRVLLNPIRGNFLDRRGRVLARDLLTVSVSAAPREMADPGTTARALAAILHLNPAKLGRAFGAAPRFVWVARRISPELAEIADRHERGVYLAPETSASIRLRGGGDPGRTDSTTPASTV
jgi:cell division protein FtsI (penicillin-binding protein 3)